MLDFPSFCWCRQIPGFRWEKRAVKDECGCHFCRDQCKNQTHCWCFALFYVLYCFLLPSSQSSAARKLKKKKVLTNSSWGSRVSIFAVDPRDKKLPPAAVPRPLLNAVSHSLHKFLHGWGNLEGPAIPKQRTGLAGRFAAASFVFKLFISRSLFPPTLLNCYTAFVFLSCRKTEKSV